MDLQATEKLPQTDGKAGRKRQRFLSVAEVARLHGANAEAHKKRRNAMEVLQAASRTARAAHALARREARTIASLSTTLPPVHDTHKDITA